MQSILKSIEVLQSKKFSMFDAHTTSKCCHGMAFMVKHIIISLSKVNLKSTQEQFLLFVEQLNSDKVDCIDQNLINKCSFHLLILGALLITSIAGCVHPHKGRVTRPQEIKKISYISTDFSRRLVTQLQRYFSKLVANSYQDILQSVTKNVTVNRVNIQTWGRYVLPKYFRKCQRKITYVSCLYSTQVILAKLISLKSIIGVISDIVDENFQLIERRVHLLQGNGENNFKVLPEDKRHNVDAKEPLLVFGGVTVQDPSNYKHQLKSISKWLEDFPALVLANDIYYPQFPKVSNDPQFNSNPIAINDKLIIQEFEKLSEVKGVTISDPSLFCLAHIFTTNLAEIFGTFGEKLSCCSTHLPRNSP